VAPIFQFIRYRTGDRTTVWVAAALQVFKIFRASVRAKDWVAAGLQVFKIFSATDGAKTDHAKNWAAVAFQVSKYLLNFVKRTCAALFKTSVECLCTQLVG